MLQLRQISKSYGARRVLRDVSVTVNEGDVLCLLGPNGAGKSTLLRIVAGLETADEGRVVLSPGTLRLGYLPQGYADATGKPAGDVIPQLALVRKLEARVARLAESLARGENETGSEYGSALDELQAATDAVERFHVLLDVWGLPPPVLSRPIESLSGGEQTKLGIAQVVAAQPDVLLLDEPTNHLDIEGLERMEEWLREFKGALLIATHDRTLLSRTTNSVLEIAERGGAARHFRGTYVSYLETIQREIGGKRAAYGRQQRELARIEETIRRLKERGQRTERKTTHHHYRKRAARVTRAAKVQERRLERTMRSGGRIEKPKQGYKLRPLLRSLPRSGDDVLVLDGVHVAVGGKTLLRDVSFELRYQDRAALLGPNGSGKTTLQRLIMGQLSPQSGSVRMGVGVVARMLSQEQDELDGQSSPMATLREVAPMEESDLRAFLHSYLFTSADVERRVSQLSYGQRARLNLARVVLGGVNLLLLDEPTNHLDIPSRESFEAALDGFEGTVLIVSHDRFFLERFASRILVIENGSVDEYAI